MRTRGLLEAVLVLVVAALTATACWIPLPEETAIVVEVYDAEGRPVDGVHVLVDGELVVTGENLGNEGRVFKSLTDAGDHIVAVEPASLIDPQGGRRHVLLASQISGETRPIYYGNRPFTGGSDVLMVPVAKGYISVVTVYLSDILQAPADNQWLTDGSLTSDFRPENGTAEFATPPAPTFWWRTEPSLGDSMAFTFQMWQDSDGDVRYPLGVADSAGYKTIGKPDWQVPNAGLQRALGIGGGRVRLLAGTAAGASAYDVYYAATSGWAPQLENNLVLRDVTGTVSGQVLTVDLGPGTANPQTAFRNGRSYRFALRARDAASNTDAFVSATTHSVRSATIQTTGALSPVNSVSVADTDNGGTLLLSINCSGVGDSLRIYASPRPDWNSRPFDPRYQRSSTVCAGTATSYSLDWLVSRQAADGAPVTYTVGVEPYDAGNNVGAAATVSATPVNAATADTTQPFWATGGSITASTGGQPPGQVRVNFDVVDAFAEASTFIRRLYFGPSTYPASNVEARAHTDLASNVVTSLTFSDIPNDVPWGFAIQAIDSYGNASTPKSTSITLSDPMAGSGPVWTTDTQSLFTPVFYPTAGTPTHPLGYTYNYNGFALTTSKSGEYVWRVIQDNGEPANLVESKLGAFYTWSGYYYATTASGGLDMISPSSNVRQRDVFGFVENQILPQEVMGAPFDSSHSAGYRQRTVQGFVSALEAGSHTSNQLLIRYVTDEDGMTTHVGLDTNRNGSVDTYGAIIEVVAVNSQGLLTPTPPYLQRKVIQTLYREDNDVLFDFPGTVLGVAFNGSLADPDSMDPKW